jgi:hypothetical protein
VIAMLAVTALASIGFSTAAFAASDFPCPHGTGGSGNPHDAENPENLHDTQKGNDNGNPRDECRGS